MHCSKINLCTNVLGGCGPQWDFFWLINIYQQSVIFWGKYDSYTTWSKIKWWGSARVNFMAADALATYVARASAAMIMNRVNPSGAKTGTSQNIWFNTIPADALAPDIAKPSPTMILTMQDETIAFLPRGMIWTTCINSVLRNDRKCKYISELILGLHPANERRRYFVTTSLIGWAQA